MLRPRNALLELISPALVRTRRDRPTRTTRAATHPVARPEVVLRTLVVRPR